MQSNQYNLGWNCILDHDSFSVKPYMPAYLINSILHEMDGEENINIKYKIQKAKRTKRCKI